MRSVAEWALRIVLAVAFIAAGVDKFIGPIWVRVFNDIGFGQWFRYVTGVVELLGGLLLLVRPATIVALPTLICTMLGALLVHVTVVGIGFQTIAVSILLALLVGLGFLYHRARTVLISNP